MKGNALTALGLCAVAALICWVTAQSFMEMWKPDVLVPAPGFEQHMLSEWEPGLAGTRMDTPVFIQEGPEPGGTIYIQGGIHPDEPAGFMAAIMYLERAQVQKGRMIVVPFVNMSARTHNYPQAASPQYIHIDRPDGEPRVFKFGARATNPIDQWPDPDIYIHHPSMQKLDGSARSNMNRAFPGSRTDGITQLAGLAVVELLKQEKVDLAFDLHEASPEYPVVNAMVAHENSMELAATVCMELEMNGIPMRLEPSPVNLRGLSHREWGDAVPGLMPLLMEAGNPSQGRLRGRTNEALALTGADKSYAKASKMGLLFIPYEKDQPLEMRTARHVAGVKTTIEMIGLLYPDKEIVVDNIPDYQEILDQGVGAWLSPAPQD